MFAKLKQKVIQVDEIPGSTAAIRENNIVPGRVRRTSQNGNSASQSQPEDANGSAASYSNGHSLQNGFDENAFVFEFASDELNGSVSPLSPASVDSKNPLLHSDVRKMKEETLQQASRYQDELAQLRLSKEFEVNQLLSKVATFEQTSNEQLIVIERLNDRQKALEQDNEGLTRENRELAERNATLQRSLCAMEQRVQQEASSWRVQVTERDDTIRRLEQSIHDLQRDVQHRTDKITELETRPVSQPAEMERLSQMIKEQAESLQEKTSVIKKQEQKLIDLQKTLRREIQSRSTGADPGSNSGKKPATTTGVGNGPTNGSAATSVSASESIGMNGSRPSSKEHMLSSIVPDSSAGMPVSLPVSRGGQHDGDGSFEYMKHVLLKFILSKEAEAIKLLRAVSMLLRLSNDEQKLVYDTLQYRMSWFGLRPELGRGQRAKDVPPCV